MEWRQRGNQPHPLHRQSVVTQRGSVGPSANLNATAGFYPHPAIHWFVGTETCHPGGAADPAPVALRYLPTVSDLPRLRKCLPRVNNGGLGHAATFHYSTLPDLVKYRRLNLAEGRRFELRRADARLPASNRIRCRSVNPPWR